MKQIEEYPEYFVTEQGEVFSTISNKVLSQAVNKGGYKFINIKNIIFMFIDS